jgi:hypothetical protein
MKYTAEMSLGAIIEITNFIKIVPAVQILIGWDTQTHTDSMVIS